MPDEDHLGTVVHHVGCGDFLGPDRARVVARESFGVAAIEHAEPQRGVDPAWCGRESDVGNELGIHGESRCEHAPRSLRHFAQSVESRPRALGVHVVGGHGRHAAPVVDAGAEQHAEVVAQVWRRLQVNLGRQYQTCHCNRPQIFLRVARGVVLHAGEWLGQEVLHDDFLHVTVARVRLDNGLERGDAIGARLADAHQDAGRERNLQFSRELERVEPALRHFVGCATVAFEVFAQRLDHHSLRRRDRAQHGEFVSVQRAGVRMGQQPRLVEHELRHVVQVVHGGVVSVRAQPVARNLVSQLGTFAEREERLVATVRRALLCDCDHLLGREVRVLQPRRGLGERAVAALVAAQHRERDEHLRRIRDARAVLQVAYLARVAQQLVERCVEKLLMMHGALMACEEIRAPCHVLTLCASTRSSRSRVLEARLARIHRATKP